MQIGTMNHPAADPVEEIRWMAEMGLQFVDLTIEPPRAASWKIDAGAIRRALEDHRLGVVGHTPFYLPIASPFEEVRVAAVNELKRCMRLFVEIGARWMNIHPDRHAPMHSRGFLIRRNLKSLEELLGEAERHGIGLMIENLPGDFNSTAQLAELLDPLPPLGLHLDIGHANLQTPVNTTGDVLAAYGHRLKHVHLHDNKGGSADLHLPLGAGTLDIKGSLRALQAASYDGPITLEVFTSDRRYLAHSCETLRTLWNQIAGRDTREGSASAAN